MVTPPLGATSWAQFFIALFTGGSMAALIAAAVKVRGQTLNSDEQIRRLLAEQLERSDKVHTAEVERLTKKLDAKDEQWMRIERHWREMLDIADKRLAESEKRHEECQLDRDRLRDRIVELEIHVRGLEEKIRYYSTDKLIELQTLCPPSEKAPHSLAAAHRLKDKENGNK